MTDETLEDAVELLLDMMRRYPGQMSTEHWTDIATMLAKVQRERAHPPEAR